VDSLYILIPIALLFLAIAIALFFWAVDDGQYEDLEQEGSRLLFDDDSNEQDQDKQSGEKKPEPGND
jgi:cbb3-type cytochrome oxidase maturation protein